MRFLALATLSVPAILLSAAPASADEVDIGLGFGGRHGGGSVDLRFGEPRPAPVVVRRVHPVPAPLLVDDCRPAYVPGHEVVRLEQVVEPAVYDERRVPVFEERREPVYRTVETPVFDVRFDARRGTRVRVRIGERLERVEVGVRTVRVQVGERVERVLVRAETVRTVERREWVPGRMVLVCDHPAGHRRHRHRDGGREVIGVAEYEREMALVRVQDGGPRRRATGG